MRSVFSKRPMQENCTCSPWDGHEQVGITAASWSSSNPDFNLHIESACGKQQDPEFTDRCARSDVAGAWRPASAAPLGSRITLPVGGAACVLRSPAHVATSGSQSTTGGESICHICHSKAQLQRRESTVDQPTVHISRAVNNASALSRT